MILFVRKKSGDVWIFEARKFDDFLVEKQSFHVDRNEYMGSRLSVW